MCDDIQQLFKIGNCSFHISDVKVNNDAIMILKVITGLLFVYVGFI